MKTHKIYNDKNLARSAIKSSIEDSLGFLADGISSILISIELDSKTNDIELDKIIRSNSVLSTKLDLVLDKFYTSLYKEIKGIFKLEVTNNKLSRKTKLNRNVT